MQHVHGLVPSIWLEEECRMFLWFSCCTQLRIKNLLFPLCHVPFALPIKRNSSGSPQLYFIWDFCKSAPAKHFIWTYWGEKAHCLFPGAFCFCELCLTFTKDEMPTALVSNQTSQWNCLGTVDRHLYNASQQEDPVRPSQSGVIWCWLVLLPCSSLQFFQSSRFSSF